MKYTDINIPSVFVTQSKRRPFEVEVSVNAIGEIVMDVDIDDYNDDNIMNHKILERDELKNIIDGLTKIYEGTE